MQRYTPEGKKRLEAMGGKIPTGDPTVAEGLQAGIEVKRPGDKDWVKASDPRAGEVTRAQCKDLDGLQVVSP
jgi:hypothetical protein